MIDKFFLCVCHGEGLLVSYDPEDKIRYVTLWIQDGHTRINIDRIFDNGVIGIRSGCVSWDASPQEFEHRRRCRKLYLQEF